MMFSSTFDFSGLASSTWHKRSFSGLEITNVNRLRQSLIKIKFYLQENNSEMMRFLKNRHWGQLRVIFRSFNGFCIKIWAWNWSIKINTGIIALSGKLVNEVLSRGWIRFYTHIFESLIFEVIVEPCAKF